MNRHERIVLWVVFVLLGVGFLLSRVTCRHTPIALPPATKMVSPASPLSTVPVSTQATRSIPLPPPVTAKSSKPKPVVSAPTGAATPRAVTLHKELIPKDITIVRCYYSQEIAPPGTRFGFDINGSGFTSEFQKMITLQSDDPEIHFKNLALVTANQIHGDIEIGANTKTAFIYPRVLIKGLPVFSAPEPFAMVRKGEVLTVFFISMEESGRGGRFRVITNMDEDMAKQFHIEPSTPGLVVSDLENHLPYIVEGILRIGGGVPPGAYGFTIKIGEKEVLRRTEMVHIVKPNLGQTGLVQGVIAEDPYHRPGDPINLFVQGSGLTPQDVNSLKATIDEFDMGPASFTYISRNQSRFVFKSPAGTPVGKYGVTIRDAANQQLFQKSGLFTIVNSNWIKGVQVSPPVHPGGKSQLRVIGRDLSPDFVGHLRIDLDASGITLAPLVRTDANVVTTDISVSTAVAPGDYWLHLSADGKKIDPPFGSIIKVEGQ